MRKSLILMFLILSTSALSTQVFAQDDVLRSSTEREALRTKIMDAYDIFNKDQYDRVSEFIDPNFVEHSPSPGQAPGLNGLIDMFKQMRIAYPDFKMTVNDVIIDGNKAAVLFTFTGTNSGQMMGMPATNKKVEVKGIDFLYFKDGKATEHWGMVEEGKMMTQLGLMNPGNEEHHKMKKDKDKMEK